MKIFGVMIPCCILGPDLEGSSSSHLFFLFSPDIKSKVNQQSEIGDLKAFVSFQQQNKNNTNKKEQGNWSIGTAKWWLLLQPSTSILANFFYLMLSLQLSLL